MDFKGEAHTVPLLYFKKVLFLNEFIMLTTP